MSSTAIAPKKVYVLDCGGQYAHLLASRVRKHEALSVIVDADTPVAELTDAGAIIVSGGPQSVFDPDSLTVDPAIWDLRVPVLGICYGMQLMCHNLGGKVETAETGEYGRANFTVAAEGAQPFDGVPPESDMWMSHRDRVVLLPSGFNTTGSTEDCPFAAVECTEGGRQLFGFQFHPEVTHSQYGEKVLGNFIDLAGLRGSWKMDEFIASQVATIQEKCSDGRKVFVLVSGGVDSTVVFSLLTKAMPGRVLGLFVDTGMMRHNEGTMVQEALEATFPGANLHFVDASVQFLAALEGETSPEKKRLIIGAQFLAVQRDKVVEFGLNPEEWLLAQGTIYPDTIESGGKKNGKQVAAVIKTHHNRVPEIDALIEAGLIVEPCADLYKDEVRAVGEKLGLPKFLVWRHPFPGPGLGVRLLCHPGTVDESIDAAALCAEEEAIKVMVGGDISVSIPHLKSVGVQGDSRTYKHFAILGGGYARDWAALDAFATKIINTQTHVNRVTASLCYGTAGSESPPYTVHNTPATCTKDRFDRLRVADHIVHEELTDAGLMASVWQCPVAMAALAADAAGSDEVIILRPVTSTEAMTAEFSRLPWEVVDKIAARIKAEVPGVMDVLYDITNKPPGTIEWE